MSYIFPKRRLRGRDILDPVELNQDVVPAAENYSGRLNPHNFDADGSYTRGTEAYIIPHYVEQEANPRFGTPDTSWIMPNSADTRSFTLATDIEWQLVDSMTRTFTTNQSVLWITGWLTYIWLEYSYNSSTSVGTHVGYEKGSARVQFAIRVDGRIIEHTITGKNDNFLQSYMPIQWDDEKVTAAVLEDGENALPGPSTIRVPPAAALGPPAMPVRLGCAVPVQPGSHTVELVCRRLGSENYRALNWPTSSGFTVLDDYVTVFNRKLLVLDIPTNPAASSSGTAVDIRTFDAEDAINATSLGTNCVDKLRDAHNAIDTDAMGRGVLNNNHLPSAIYDYCQVEFAPGSIVSTNNQYPGFNEGTTIASATSGPDIGWTIVHDGVSMTAAANLLRSDATHAAAFDATTKKSFFVVQANVRFINLERTSSSPQHDDPSSFGTFALGYQLSGSAAPVIIESTICFVSHHQTLSGLTNVAGGDIPENIDVPLFWCLDLTETLLSANIDYFGVYTAVAGHPSGHEAEIHWKHGHLMVLKLPA